MAGLQQRAACRSRRPVVAERTWPVAVLRLHRGAREHGPEDRSRRPRRSRWPARAPRRQGQQQRHRRRHCRLRHLQSLRMGLPPAWHAPGTVASIARGCRKIGRTAARLEEDGAHKKKVTRPGLERTKRAESRGSVGHRPGNVNPLPAAQSASRTAAPRRRCPRFHPGPACARVPPPARASIAATTRSWASRSPRWSSIIAPAQIAAIGLAMPRPAMSGAEPWMGSNIDGYRAPG